MEIPYDNFDQYRSHFVPIVIDPKTTTVDVMLTDQSPYGKMTISYYDINFDETLNENDEATMSFRYDIIEKEPSYRSNMDTPEYSHEYAGNYFSNSNYSSIEYIRKRKINLNYKGIR
jgi:hypothetical protein